jgi:hypothetical protein
MRSRYMLIGTLLTAIPSTASAALPDGSKGGWWTQPRVAVMQIEVPHLIGPAAGSGEGGYLVAQAGALKFLRNIPVPRLRVPKPSALPDMGSITRGLKSVPQPRTGALAKAGPNATGFSLLPKGLRKLPSPSYQKLTAAAKRLRPNPKELAKDLAISGGMLIFGIVPGEIVSQIYPVEGAEPARRVDNP